MNELTELRDHPDIEWCERTGYPPWAQPKSIYCDNCGICLDELEVYEDNNHEYLCEECLLSIHSKRRW